MSQPQEDGIIRFGDVITLKHVSTDRVLNSSGGQQYEGGSNQQKVFTTEGTSGEESQWIVLPPPVTEEEPGYEVGFEDKFRLVHVSTRAHLHSHDIDSPVSGQQEVSCFGNDDQTDENDIWQVLQYDEDDEQYDNFWRLNQPVLIKHVETNNYLHSHDIVLTEGQNEVTAYCGKDNNDQWAAFTQ